MKCGDANCTACNPVNTELKLHGWITPEYAEQMIEELTKWLEKVKNASL